MKEVQFLVFPWVYCSNIVILINIYLPGKVERMISLWMCPHVSVCVREREIQRARTRVCTLHSCNAWTRSTFILKRLTIPYTSKVLSHHGICLSLHTHTHMHTKQYVHYNFPKHTNAHGMYILWHTQRHIEVPCFHLLLVPPCALLLIFLLAPLMQSH